MNLKQLAFSFIIFSLVISCGTSERIIVNKKIIDIEGEPMLVGRITQEALSDSVFNSWYSEQYDSYTPDLNVVKKIKSRLKLYNIEVFLGTWSEETQKQLPRFMKVLETSKFPESKLALYAVNRNKESFYGEQNQKNINEIPTFIIYKGNINKKRGLCEIGRISGKPNQTFELDLYKIVTGKKFNEVTNKPKHIKIKKSTRKK
ncbi:hypothetical protein [Apibacter sp. HY039]|uniref:hypothetical protein n=1 Tax=Apibacter sp. HY039 TaxID=2501476 RepID=UPI000FEBFC46|nr:hypothetical protein [Apibacter sp. HY039]